MAAILPLAVTGAVLVFQAGCPHEMNPPSDTSAPRDDETPSADEFQRRRQKMVDRQLRARDITDERVLETMNRVPRHRFVPESWRRLAYSDQALPLDQDQTISQPYIVALMTQLAQPGRDSRVLDVGTGSGYQAAVLAELCDQVYSIEIVESLATSARERLARMGYDNIEVRHGDGFRGWPEQAPFDAIVVAAAPSEIPQPLIDQLARGGTLVIPVGDDHDHQQLIVVRRLEDGRIQRRVVAPVAFVPMTGEAQKKRRWP